MAIIDSAVYVGGHRIDNPTSLDQTFEYMREHGGTGWIGLLRPSADELERVAAEFSLHPLAVEDALSGHQRPKLERYGDDLFVVLRPARYVEAEDAIEFGELHVFVGTDYVVTVRHAEVPDLSHVRKRLEGQPDLLAQGPQAVLYAILDEVVDGYDPVARGLQNDIDEMEDALFGADGVELSQRIYRLSREVIHLQRAGDPLRDMLESLLRGADKYDVDIEVKRSLRDVLDHVIRVSEKLASMRAILDNALTVNATLVTQRQTETSLKQNDQVKKISGWAAILFGPTLIGGIYGMNFDDMPELHWAYGYPFALALMLVTSVTLWAVFKLKRWL
ncbi:magnesium/cobalt transporter CorA [Microbacterium sp. HMH0099]|uniref:magnesium/cobalt transporter CorA n=1 Tax=Microbacterium sp. HMH0099 TaxID=3414026 RepID=UPI003BF6C868